MQLLNDLQFKILGKCGTPLILQRAPQRVTAPKYLLFVCVHQLLVVSVLELSWCFCSRQGGMEDEQLPRALGCLKSSHKRSGWYSFILRESQIYENPPHSSQNGIKENREQMTVEDGDKSDLLHVSRTQMSQV